MGRKARFKKTFGSDVYVPYIPVVLVTKVYSYVKTYRVVCFTQFIVC